MNAGEAYALVERFTSPSGGKFYRTLYKMDAAEPPRVVDDAREWDVLPYVTKDALLDMPLTQRLFTPSSAMDHIRTSSGTSGKPPLLCPRTMLRHMEYRHEYHDFRGAILSYVVPIMPHWHAHMQKGLGYLPRVVTFDPKNPAATVRLAKAAGVDSISVFAFHMTIIAEHFHRAGIGERIKFIEIAGEACTKRLFEYMRQVFPNAVIIPFFGSSEVEDCPIGMPCRPITGDEPLSLYHAKPSQYHEIINPETDARVEPTVGAEGELVVSAYPGEPASFPLIRYRTGDMVRVVEERCPRHGQWSFTVLGRTGTDFIKVPGGVLRADEIERVLRSMPEAVSDRFELHVFEVSTPGGPQLAPVLHVEPRAEVSLAALAESIGNAVRVAPQYTYADGVKKGRYAPLRCEKLILSPGAKHKRIVRHM